MTPRSLLQARALAPAAGLLELVALVLVVASLPDPWPPSSWLPRTAAAFVLPLPFVAGLVVTRRRSDNVLGWAFLWSSLFFAVNIGANAVATLAHARGEDDVGAWAAWVVEWAWVPAMAMLVWSLARFPGDVRRPSDRVADVLATAMILLVGVLEATLVGSFQNVDWYDNPAGVLDRDLGLSLEPVGFLPMSLLGAWAIGRGIRLFSRTTGIERQQLRWVAWAAVPLLATIVAGAFVRSDGAAIQWVAILNVVGMFLLVLGLAVAVLRYRLWDLDRLISRTLTYALLTGTLLGMYAAGVLVIGTILRGLTGDLQSVVAVATSTILAFAAIAPLRRRLQGLIDRRLDRSRYDAQRIIEGFGTELVDQFDQAAVADGVAAACAAALGPTQVAVWQPDRHTSVTAGP